MGSTTVYDVVTRYRVDDQSSASFARLEKSLAGVSAASKRTRSELSKPVLPADSWGKLTPKLEKQANARSLKRTQQAAKAHARAQSKWASAALKRAAAHREREQSAHAKRGHARAMRDQNKWEAKAFKRARKARLKGPPKVSARAERAAIVRNNKWRTKIESRATAGIARHHRVREKEARGHQRRVLRAQARFVAKKQAMETSPDARRPGTGIAGVAGMLGGGMLLGGAKRAFIDFNASMEQSRITMAGMLKLNLGGTFAESMAKASKLVKQYQADAKASVGTTQDFVQMGQSIIAPITRAGLGMEDLREITKGAVVAARAFGIQAEVAALDISQALGGTLSSKDRFARALLEPMKISTKEFNKMSARARADVFKSALTQPAIAEMAQAQEKSFSGVMSTFEDAIQMTLGKIGLPLFKAMTAEVQGWNRWIDANADTIDEFATKFSSGLATGFGYVRDVVGFIVEHADLLMIIAKGFLAFKAGKMAAGFMGQFAAAGRGVAAFSKNLLAGGNSMRQITSATTAAAQATGGLTAAFTNAIPMIGMAVAGIAAAFSFAAADSNRHQKDARKMREKADVSLKGAMAAENDAAFIARVERKKFADRSAIEEAQYRSAVKRVGSGNKAREEADRALLQLAMKEGVIVEKMGDLVPGGGRLGELWSGLETEQASRMVKALRGALERRAPSPRDLAKFLTPDEKEDMTTKKARGDLDGINKKMAESMKRLKKGGPAKVTVNIKNNVRTADPARFVHDLNKILNKGLRSKTRASGANLLEGGV